MEAAMVAKKKKKTTARKSTKKKKTTGKRATHTVRFKCDGGCVAAPDPLRHLEYGDTVLMKAIGTDVVVRFPGRSPFSKKVFNIAAGGSASATVNKRNSETFSYRIKCEECAIPAIPPQMIID
jgi:hypothetical protein